MSPKYVKLVLSIILGISMIYVIKMAWSFGIAATTTSTGQNTNCARKIKRPSLRTTTIMKRLGELGQVYQS